MNLLRLMPVLQVSGTEKPDQILKNCPHASQVSMMRVASEDAKGPTYGRYICMYVLRWLGFRGGLLLTPSPFLINTSFRYLGSKLVGDQEFCMQIDAHMDFEDDWDKKLMDMWGR